MKTFCAALALVQVAPASATFLRINETSCDVPDETRPTRDGERFKFNLMGKDSMGVDSSNRLYQYGRKNSVPDVDQCSWECTNEVDDFLASNLRGIDYDCKNKYCDCLFDDTVLDGTLCDDYFDSCSFSGSGKGSISGTSDASGWSSYKLVGMELLDGTPVQKIEASTVFKGAKSPKLDVNESASCAVDETRPTRNGERFKFNLIAEDSECNDSSGRLYQLGRFYDVPDVDQCAWQCVNEVSDYLASELRGFDFNCDSLNCDCLYDDTVLTDSLCDTYFDACSFEPQGKGSISGSAYAKDWTCYKLVGAELLAGGVAEETM
eukprot:CAMPEP_0171421126 /NCGR_PEP_ID=MMETSP0881-20121228/429_1 /TAXON_ID=67004 /ORGANISM="Thalassiosira weissflogii, Strain CCMP1336" /LENGTH=320 /DNA_ID=CAMNT_0011939525 /DNA_START=83 /DNA_END=1045 /DNA_ORIENTATION=+